MALHHGKRVLIDGFWGLQTLAEESNLDPHWWSASSNVVVTADGSAAVLRSPANFNTATAHSNVVLSTFDAAYQSGNIIYWDIQIGSVAASSVRTYSTTGGANTTVRSNQAEARWKRLMLNDMAYSLNGTEFIQLTSVGTAYAVGITAPSVTPTVSFVAGGSGSLTVGVTVSYAYRNSVTGHVSAPSTASASSGASGGSLTLRTAVTASSQTGVDGIILYITADGGSIRYLYTNTTGDPVIHANSTGNIDISLALLTNLDTLTPETSYNSVPPQNAFFQFKWGDRLCLCDFRGATTRQQVQYNVYENCYYGIPWESWWPFNIINIPNKSDAARSGIETPLGALILGEQDSYLIRGSLTDKISAPEATISVTEHMQALNWSIGTRSPYTLKTTPFGEMWLDQNKRIQLWQRSGFPDEAGLPIRSSLAAILDTDSARNMAEAEWYQHGDDGGHYVLTASTSGSTNNTLFIVTVYKDPEDNRTKWACSVSDIAAQSITNARISGRVRSFIGVTDRLREILDLDLAGAGWSSGQTRSFSNVWGSGDEYCYFHSIRFDATDVTGLTVTIANLDGSDQQDVEIEQDGLAYYGTLDSYGYEKEITFTFSSNDSTKRVVENIRVATSPKQRLL